jgi:glycosyltransferase involved in cell wall biosynthesis
MKKASIIIATKNQAGELKECIDAAVKQDYPKKDFEVIVMDDGSTDKRQEEIIKAYGKGIKVVWNKGNGRVLGLNKSIKLARFPFACISAGDIIFRKDFLKTIMGYFTSEKIGFVSPFHETGGNATVYSKKAVMEAGYFDPEFNEKGTGFRDDTDLVFRIWDKGYKGIFTYDTARFRHEHETPSSISGKLKYAWARIKIHRFDALLYKKHPERAKEFFDIKLGFIRNPLKDFAAATGLWWKGTKRKDFALSSPQGVKLVEAKTPLHFLAIILLGLLYVLLVKLARLYGSIKYGTLLL